MSQHPTGPNQDTPPPDANAANGQTNGIRQFAGDHSTQIGKARDINIIKGDKHVHGHEIHAETVYVDAGPPSPSQGEGRGAGPPPLHRPPRAQHFQGRQDEIDAVLRHLQLSQFVTLCGPGGIGKTAIAREVVDRLAPANDPPERFPDGVFLHSFYTHPQASAALESITTAYGLERRPDSAAARQALSARTALLILDGAENADDLSAVLDIAGNCAVLITSRRRSDARGELIVVEPLPDANAISLFRALAGPRAGDDETVKRICQLVGNLPLALQLAGSYVKRTQIDAVRYLRWLTDTPLAALDFGDRQRDSVPILIERSLEKVTGHAQSALAVVGLLALAPFCLDTIAAALDRDPDHTARLLGELVAFNLLHRPQDRYTVPHALIHTYARQCLEPSTTEVERLGGYYAALFVDRQLRQPPLYIALDPDRSHALAVLSICATRQRWEAAHVLSVPLEKYLEVRGHWTDSLQVLDIALQSARARGERRHEGACLGHLGIAYRNLGHLEQAIDSLEAALGIARETGNRDDESAALCNLGNTYRDQGDISRAILHHTLALDISRDIENRRGQCATLGELGSDYLHSGNSARAAQYYDESLTLARETGDNRVELEALGNVGHPWLAQGHTEEAISLFEDALARARQIGDRNAEANSLASLGCAHAAAGDRDLARQCLRESLAIFEQTKSPRAGRVRARLAALDANAPPDPESDAVSRQIPGDQLAARVADDVISAMTVDDTSQRGQLWQALSQLRARAAGHDELGALASFLDAVCPLLEGAQPGDVDLEPPFSDAWRRIQDQIT